VLRNTRTSKITLAAVKPNKWVVSGLKAKVRTVAMTPVMVTTPDDALKFNTTLTWVEMDLDKFFIQRKTRLGMDLDV
jgi:hypothetical protein